MARPRKQIDQKQFENLCGLQCTEVEIASFFDCSVDTIERFCKRTYNASFAETYKKYSKMGIISLRRNQFKLSEKSATMAIWLGKQMLGQEDKIQIQTVDEKALDELETLVLLNGNDETEGDSDSN